MPYEKGGIFRRIRQELSLNLVGRIFNSVLSHFFLLESLFYRCCNLIMQTRLKQGPSELWLRLFLSRPWVCSISPCTVITIVCPILSQSLQRSHNPASHRYHGPFLSTYSSNTRINKSQKLNQNHSKGIKSERKDLYEERTSLSVTYSHPLFACILPASLNSSLFWGRGRSGT